jgi:group I intron endonuclease
MTCGVYKLVAPSDNFYIGSSKNIRKRYNTHMRELRLGLHKNEALSRAFKKYGNLELFIVLICLPEDRIMYEQACIDALCPRYNNSKIAGKVEMTTEVRAKISAVHRGKTMSPRTRRAISKALKGRCHSAETIKKISDTKRLRYPPKPKAEKILRPRVIIFGRRHTPEELEKMSRKALGNRRAAGHKCTPEARAIMSAKAKARWARMRATGVYSLQTPESIAKTLETKAKIRGATGCA